MRYGPGQRAGHSPPKKQRSKSLATREGGIGTPSHRHSAGHEAASIAREHGAPAGHRYLARQNLAQPMSNAVATTRSKATAQKEGGIVHQTREPREAGIGRQPSRRQQAKDLHQQALQLYHQGNHRDAIKLEREARSLAGISSSGIEGRVAGAIYHNPVVGHKGLIGGAEDFAATLNPVTLAKTLIHTAEHPLAARSSHDLNAGMVVGGPGAGGFRLARRLTGDEVIRGIGAHDLEVGQTFRPDLYTKHPTSGYMVRNDHPRSALINEPGKPPRIHDTVPAPHRMGNEVPVPGSVRPPKYLFRAISEEDYQRALKHGHLKSDQRMNLADEGTVASLVDPRWYLPGKLASDPHGTKLGRVVRIKYRDEDGWILGTDGYVKTPKSIPVHLIDAAPQFRVTKGNHPSSITGNPVEHIRTDFTGVGYGDEAPGRLVIPSDKSIVAKEGEARIVRRPATKEEAAKRLRALDKQLEGFYRQVEKKIGHPLAEGDIAQEVGRSHTIFGTRAKGRSVEGRVHGQPVKRASVGEQLSGAAQDYLERLAKNHPDHPTVQRLLQLQDERALLTQALHGHMPGEGPDSLPPVPAGHVRLFRGEGKRGPIDANVIGDVAAMDKGGWFSDNRAVAETYAKKNKGKLYYVDVPEAVARPWGRRRMNDNAEYLAKPSPENSWTEYRFPPEHEIRTKKVPVGDYGVDIAEAKLTPEAQMRREVIPAARMGNREVEALRKVERSKRMEAGEAAREEAVARTGKATEGYKAFLREQRGALPDIPLDRLSDASKEDIEQLFRVVDAHEGLKRWEKVAAQRAIDRLVGEGRRPRPHEVRHLTTVFGPEFTEHLIQTTLKDRALGIIGVPRSIMASFDVSAPFRQNLVALFMEPRLGLRNFGSMYRSFRPTKGGEADYAASLAKIHAHPDYEFAIDSGLSLTELADKPGKREEAFPSQYAEQIPGAGRIVRGSGRAYTIFNDNMRFQMFAKYVDILRKKGIDPESYPELKGVAKVLRAGHEYPNTYAEGIAKLVNSATGRGSLKNVESWGPFMNVMFFSPRLMYSRINFLDPSWYFRLDPFSRRQALKGVARLSTTAAGSFALATWLGAQVGTDPRSANFAKIRIGNTRIDILGGFQQYIRLAAQLYTGEIVSSTTGKVTTLGHGYGQQNRLSILARFAQGKLSPPASLVTDFFRGTDFAEQPFQWKYAILSRITPLVAQDALDLYRSSGSAPLTALAYLVSAHGVGMQTYSNAATKGQEKKVEDAAAEQDTHIKNLVRKGILDRENAPDLRHVLDLLNERDAARKKIESDIDSEHPHTRAKQKLLAYIAVLVKGKELSRAGAREWREWANHQRTTDEINKGKDHLWNETVGDRIAWYRDKTGYSG